MVCGRIGEAALMVLAFCLMRDTPATGQIPLAKAR
jgi:hypothetical protein